MNVLFLDIDGVINDNTSKYSLNSIILLKQLINKFNTKIVIISSLQGNGTSEKRNKIKNQLYDFGIHNIEFIDPNFEGGILDIKLPSRVLGVIDYLKNNSVDNYVILDDDYHNDYKLVCLNHYRTLAFKGLTFKDLNKIILKPVNLNIFRYVNYKHRQLGEYELITNQIIKVLKKYIEKK